jgi:pimeloyl-ACP methyl ester carboxylesterase
MTRPDLASSAAIGAVSLFLLASGGYAQTQKEATMAQVAPAAPAATKDNAIWPFISTRRAWPTPQEMGNRPQTLYAIEDSPVGLAAWMLDHDARSYELIARVFAGQSEGLTRDDILDNITLYWLTNTAVSSARLYWESKLPFFAPKGIAIPVAVSAFPDEIYTAPRSWTERAYPKLIHYNRLPKGGHFAAWEQPKLFIEDVRYSTCLRPDR